MQLLTQASASEPSCRSATLAALCCRCAEFLPSERMPSVGICLLHVDRVLAHDKACSQYYHEPDSPAEAYAPAGSDDEF